MQDHRVETGIAGAHPNSNDLNTGALSDGRPGWYILRCGGGTEFRARDALSELGCYAYVPIERKWRARWLRKPVEVRYPRFPRYLFAHVTPPAWPDWASWPLSRFIRGVLAMDGRPVPLAPGEFERLRAEDGHLVVPAASLHKAYVPGQRVRIRYGPFAAFEAELDAIDEGGARMTVQIFGRPTPLTQPLGWLEAA